MPKRTSDGRVPSSARVDEPAVADEHRYEDGGSALQERSLRTQPQEDVGCPRSCLGTAAEPRLQVVELGLRPPAAAALRFRRRRLVEPARFELRLLHAAQSSAKSLSLRVAGRQSLPKPETRWGGVEAPRAPDRAPVPQPRARLPSQLPVRRLRAPGSAASCAAAPPPHAAPLRAALPGWITR